jgi:hypothetical protein
VANGTPLRARVASLKLSGHLITVCVIDGRLFFAAKNSTSNAYVVAAELLLQQLLGTGEQIASFIRALDEARACISFECVTSVNGDHGYPDRPAINAMFATAIHTQEDDNTSTPWNFIAIYEFCRRIGLPCTETLLAFDYATDEKLMNFYAGIRHQFAPHARQVAEFFQAATSEMTAAVMQAVPHEAFISPVVEGMVCIGYELPPSDLQKLLELADAPSKALDMTALHSTYLSDLVSSIVPDGCLTTNTDPKYVRALRQHVVLPVVYPEKRGSVRFCDVRKTTPDLSAARPELLALVTNASPDAGTQRFLALLRVLEENKINGCFNVYHNTLHDTEDFYEGTSLLFLQIHSDAAHFRLASLLSALGDEAMPLYRGHVVRLQPMPDGTIAARTCLNFYPKFDNVKATPEELLEDLWVRGIVGGILKFKFSFYMYLTMCARTLVQDYAKAAQKGSTRRRRASSPTRPPSLETFLEVCVSRFASWGMSTEQQVPYLTSLEGWWTFLDSRATQGLPPVEADTYLDAWKAFLEQP